MCGELQALASAFHTQLPHPHTMREKQYIDIHMLTQQLLSSLAAGGHRDHPQLHSSRGHGHRQQAGPSSAQTHTAQKALPRRTPYARPRTATEPRAPPEGLALIRRERGRDMRGGPAPSSPSLPQGGTSPSLTTCPQESYLQRPINLERGNSALRCVPRSGVIPARKPRQQIAIEGKLYDILAALWSVGIQKESCASGIIHKWRLHVITP